MLAASHGHQDALFLLYTLYLYLTSITTGSMAKDLKHGLELMLLGKNGPAASGLAKVACAATTELIIAARDAGKSLWRGHSHGPTHVNHLHRAHLIGAPRRYCTPMRLERTGATQHATPSLMLPHLSMLSQTPLFP